MSFNLVQLKTVDNRCYVPVIECTASKIKFFAYLASNSPNEAKDSKEVIFFMINLMDTAHVNNYNQLLQNGNFAIISVDCVSKEVIVEMDSKVLHSNVTLNDCPRLILKTKNFEDESKNIDGASVFGFPGKTATKFVAMEQNDKNNLRIIRKFCDIPHLICNNHLSRQSVPLSEQVAACGFSVTASFSQMPAFLNLAGKMRQATPEDFNPQPPKQSKASKDSCLVM
jgi:hypothetical protein